MPRLLTELRALADRELARERPGHTLVPTALVHEVYLRFAEYRKAGWQSRSHFLAVVVQAMRRILVDHARRRRAGKRGGDAVRVALDDQLGGAEHRGVDLLALDQALDRLAELDPRQAKLVELRYFGGLTAAETAEVMGLSAATINRQWATARLWLFRQLGPWP